MTNAPVSQLQPIVERLRREGADAFNQKYSLGMFKLCAEAADEIERLRAALELLTTELPEEMHDLDEPDEDWRVVVKMRALARAALSPSTPEVTG